MKQKKNNIGFTLIELLVVLVILGLLAGLVGPKVMKYVGGAKSDTARLQLEDIGAALDLFYLDNSRYPSSNEGLQALSSQPAGFDNWNGPYLKKKQVPSDPWGNPYNYVMPGQHGEYDLYSLGADNAAGGEKDDKDINNWE
jgi:general secretion pathway protein G